MGQSSQQTTQSSSTAPGAAAMPTVTGLMGALNPLIANTGLTSPQQTAINQITANGQAGNPYAAGVGNVATNLLQGGNATNQTGAVNDAYQQYAKTLAPYTASGYSTLNSPAVQAALAQAGTDATNAVNSQFAAAGRSGSGMNAQELGRGIAAAEAPIILGQANADTATSMGAANSLYGAGNTTANTIAGYNQNAVNNQQAGIPAATSALAAQNAGPQAVIAAQELGQSIPASNLGLLANIGTPLASLFTNSNGTSNTTTNPSLLSQITGVGNMFASGAGGTSAAAGLGQAAAGAGSGLLGLLAAI